MSIPQAAHLLLIYLTKTSKARKIWLQQWIEKGIPLDILYYDESTPKTINDPTVLSINYRILINGHDTWSAHIDIICVDISTDEGARMHQILKRLEP